MEMVKVKGAAMERGSQIFVKDLDGGWHCVQFSSSCVSGSELKERLESCLGVPAGIQRLVTGTLEVGDETLLVAEDDGYDSGKEVGSGGGGRYRGDGYGGGGVVGPALLPSCTLLLRLLGGKGGFGSLLRGAATKAGQKKTTNFDACRDMSGRRLRHVNAEKKLKEWQRDGKQRDLEKAALQFLRKTEKERIVEAGRSSDMAKLKEESAEARDMVVDAVVSGLEAAREKKRQRQMESDGGQEQAGESRGGVQKRIRMLEMLEAVDESDEEDSDCENGAAGNDDHEGNKRDRTGAFVPGSSDSEGSGDGSSPRGPLRDGPFALLPVGSADGPREDSGEDKGGSPSDRSSTGADSSGSERANGSCAGVRMAGCVRQEVGNSGSPAAEDDAPCLAQLPALDNVNYYAMTEERRGDDLMAAGIGCRDQPESLTSVAHNSISGISSLGCIDASTSVVTDGDSLCLDKINTSRDLEMLGLERLKAELQKHGLKCGGSLEERAARLFLLKSTPLQLLDKKHFARPSARKGN